MAGATDRPDPLRVLIAGGGVASLEALLALRDLAGDPFVASTQMGTTGAVAFLEKGFSRDELIEAIQSAARW